MPIQKLQHRNLSDVAQEELLRLIVGNVLAPGERLNEVHLAKNMGISRAPLREGARKLESMGLVTSRPRQGFYVANFTAEQIVELYDFKACIDPAVIDDFLTHSDVGLRRMIYDDIATITPGEKRPFAQSLLAYRERLASHIHNRYLRDTALSLYRKFFIVTALLDVDDKQARMGRIIDTQRAFWAAMISDNRQDALQIMREDGDFWRQDVAPYFANDT